MRALLLLIITINTPVLMAQSDNPVNIYQEPTGDGGFQYFAHNVALAPYQLEINFPELNNLKSSVTLPHYLVVYPGQPVPLLTLDPVDQGSTSFKSGYKLTLGDPEALIDADFVYALPFEDDQAYIMVQGANGAYSHQGKYAWDFAMPEGTEVCASRDGWVVQVKEDSNLGGSDASFMPHANRVTIMHEDGSYADYAHLQQHGALVNEGDKVVAGQVIGYSGNTGWSTKPHLHFQVYQAVKFGIQTLPAKFITANGVVSEMREQVSYQAVNP
jgi:murein DD-endopeptidase MepM/ murein hydrolase activator NlpD